MSDSSGEGLYGDDDCMDDDKSIVEALKDCIGSEESGVDSR